MASVVSAQTDFSVGELDPSVKRDNKSPIVQAGVRQATNFRILNTKGMQNRSGRRALFKANDRVEEFLIAPGVTYYIAFPSAGLKIYDSTGTLVFTDTARPWNATTARDVRYAIFDKSIYITAAGMTPRILTWDGSVTWTGSDFAENVLGTQKRTLFYRIAPKGITLSVAALTGNGIGITFSANVLVAGAAPTGMVGTRIRYQGRQMQIASVANGTTGTVDIKEALSSNSMHITFTAIFGTFAVGDYVGEVFGTGAPTGAGGTVTAVGVGNIDVTLTTTQSFAGAGFNIKTASTAYASQTAATFNAAVASVIWDQEVMNSYQGWPKSVFVDQNRLGFCNFPSVPQGIGWSAVVGFTDFYSDAFATDGLSTDAIFELVPDKRQVQDVVPGMDASEFVFCDKGLLYIQITPANPLKPGSVVFNTISEDECGNVQPRRAGEFIIYATAGLNQLMALRIYGAYTRAYKTDTITDLAAHLFTSIAAIAIMTASASFAERYIFILNGDGTVVAGKYTLSKNNELEPMVGWTPWSGNGTVKFISCKGANILFTTSYAPNGISAVQLVELLDDSRYLDASQLYNTQPSGLPIPGGKGPLWYLAGGTVDLMDGPLGTRMMGTYVIDANGFLVPQNLGGEDFTSVNLVVGQAWTATLEPFIPPVQEGQNVGQRMKERSIAQASVYVSNSTGFAMQRLYSGQYGANLPAVGTVMSERRVPMWMQGDDPTQPPYLREAAYFDRPNGAAFDPRWRVVKDTPGPLTIEELNFEITV